MTLSTDIGITGGNITAREVYDFINSFLVPPGTVVGSDTKSYSGDNDVKYLGNSPGQGFSAWLGITYRDDGPLYTEDQFDEDYLTTKACDILVNFDTAYGYRGSHGESCSTLHSNYIRLINQWVTSRGGKLWWRNEFSGEYFDGLDGLDKFGDDGESAFAWFMNDVKPAIEGMMGK